MKEEAVPGFVSLRPGIPRLLIEERRVAGFFSCARHPAGQQNPRARARGGRKTCPRYALFALVEECMLERGSNVHKRAH